MGLMKDLIKGFLTGIMCGMGSYVGHEIMSNAHKKYLKESN